LKGEARKRMRKKGRAEREDLTLNLIKRALGKDLAFGPRCRHGVEEKQNDRN